MKKVSLNDNKIEIPLKYIKLKPITICPETFIPEMNVVIEKNYYEDIKKNYDMEMYDIKNITINGNVKINYTIEYFDTEAIDRTTPEYVSFDRMYAINDNSKIFRTPLYFLIEEKSKIRVQYTFLAKKYIKILEPIVYIDKDLKRGSNKDLILLCDSIINLDYMSDNEIIETMGFVQGIMFFKGYIDVGDEEHISFSSKTTINEDYIQETIEMKNPIDDNKTIKIKLHYDAWNSNNFIDEFRSPVFCVNEKNIIFLNFITNIIEIKNDKPRYSVPYAVNYIKNNMSEFKDILSQFIKDYRLESDILETFDRECLAMLIEWFYDDYIPEEFYEYDCVSELNPNGLQDGCGVYAFEIVE